MLVLDKVLLSNLHPNIGKALYRNNISISLCQRNFHHGVLYKTSNRPFVFCTKVSQIHLLIIICIPCICGLKCFKQVFNSIQMIHVGVRDNKSKYIALIKTFQIFNRIVRDCFLIVVFSSRCFRWSLIYPVFNF